MSVQEAVHKFAPDAETSYDWDLRNSTGPLAKIAPVPEGKQASDTNPATATAATAPANGSNNKKRD